MPIGTPKKVARNLPVGRNNKSKTKTGSSTQKKQRKPPTPRFYEVKIRITADEYARGLPYFDDQKYLSKFILDSYRERLNRNEANNKAARLRMLAGNVELLEPVLQEMFRQGKLDFLNGKTGWEK